MTENIFKKGFRSFFTVQFLRFLFAGGIAAAVNFTVGYLLRNSFLEYYVLSVAAGFTAGTIISFILNKFFTFKAHDEKTGIQLIKFLAMAAVAVFLASFVSYLVLKIIELISIQGLSTDRMETLAHMISIGIVMIFNFLVMKYFTFSRLTKKREEG